MRSTWSIISRKDAMSAINANLTAWTSESKVAGSNTGILALSMILKHSAEFVSLAL